MIDTFHLAKYWRNNRELQPRHRAFTSASADEDLRRRSIPYNSPYRYGREPCQFAITDDEVVCEASNEIIRRYYAKANAITNAASEQLEAAQH